MVVDSVESLLGILLREVLVFSWKKPNSVMKLVEVVEVRLGRSLE